MPKTNKIIQSFNSGELSQLMDARIDQAKYASGCRTMENFMPLIYGGAQRRPGLEYIATQKSSSAKGRVVAFEHSVDDTYILLFENQVIRFFKSGAIINDGVGTEGAEVAAAGTLVAHWKMNEVDGTDVDNAEGTAGLDGTASSSIQNLRADGKVGTGSFDMDGQYSVTVSDAAALSFDDSGSNPFSITAWVDVQTGGELQSIFSKWREDTNKEYRLSLSENRKLQLHLNDDSVNLNANTVSQWKLNDTDADTIVDDTRGLQAGVAEHNVSTYTTTGKPGMGLELGFDFNTATRGVTVANNAAYNFGNAGGTADSPFSLAAWVKWDGTGGDRYIVSKWDSNDVTKREWRLNLQNGRPSFWLSDTVGDHAFLYADDAISADEWHFIVATYDGNESSPETGMIIYIDNVAVAQAAGNNSYSAMKDTTQKVFIGAQNASGAVSARFTGLIDNVIIFDIELSTSQISNLWNNGAGTESLSTTSPYAITDTALSTGWHFLAATYDSSGGSTAASGIILYVDGVAVDITAFNETSYVAMEGTGVDVLIGGQLDSGGSDEKFLQDKIDNVALYSTELSSTQINTLFSATPYEVITPYLTADLFALKFEHSADVTFITHPNYEPRRLSRTGDTAWTLAVEILVDGPFRDQNTNLSFFITPSGTLTVDGACTLTASGTDNNPFVMGTTAGHSPSGSLATSKSQTGALFKLLHASATPSVSAELVSNVLNTASATLTVYKGVTWDYVTQGTWGTAGNSATVVLERSFDAGTTYETLFSVTSAGNRNASTSGTEEVADAIYRARISEVGGDTTICSIQLSIRDTDHIGIVKITSVTSPTVAIGTVIKAIGSTNKTHRYSEGSFSNRRGWPVDVTISAEDRLTYLTTTSEPLNVWGSAVGDFTDYAGGTDDDDSIAFTLVGTGQQNQGRWIISKKALIIGTVGGEHLLGASDDNEALTPTNVQAKVQTTYGSENVAAIMINQAILFLQRGGKKIREFLYDFESDAHKADDLTVFSNEITGDGILDMTFQRAPDPMLWCTRSDGQMAVMAYERDQDVFSWCRLVTQTKNGTDDAADSVFESAAIIYGGTNSEDEIWVAVKRVLASGVVRYIERFTPRVMPSSIADMKYLDSFITDTGGDTTIEGLTHLVGQTVQVLGDGLVQATKVVNGSGVITAATVAAKYQVGLGYTATVKPMKIDLQGMGLAVTIKINRGVFNVFETIGGQVGTSTSKLHDIPTGTAALFTGSKEIPLSGGYSREGDIIAQQTQPLPMTVLSFSLDIGANAD